MDLRSYFLEFMPPKPLFVELMLKKAI